MQIYTVGGAIRDKLLGLPVKDRDFVVVGTTPEVMVAKGYGVSGSKVSERKDLQPALKTMLEHDGSYLLEVMVGQEDNVFPMVPQGCSVSEIRLS